MRGKWGKKKPKKEMDNRRISMTLHMTISSPSQIISTKSLNLSVNISGFAPSPTPYVVLYFVIYVVFI